VVHCDALACGVASLEHRWPQATSGDAFVKEPDPSGRSGERVRQRGRPKSVALRQCDLDHEHPNTDPHTFEVSTASRARSRPHN